MICSNSAGLETEVAAGRRKEDNGIADVRTHRSLIFWRALLVYWKTKASFLFGKRRGTIYCFFQKIRFVQGFIYMRWEGALTIEEPAVPRGPKPN